MNPHNTPNALPPTATAYERLAYHLANHAYTRGVNKGDAPADASRRARSHFRVVRRSPTRLAVLFHRTDILTVTSDAPDTLVLNTDGYHANPTTREAYWGLGRGPLFALPRILLATPPTRTPRPVSSQTSILGGAFYDGLTLDLVRTEDGRPLRWEPRDPKPLTRFVADREARRAVLGDPRVKAFFAALPVIYDGAIRSNAAPRVPTGPHVFEPENWPNIIKWAYHQTRWWVQATPEFIAQKVRARLTDHLTKEVPV